MPRVSKPLSKLLLCAPLLLTVFTGCVRREMVIESDPPGALVYLNGQEVGRTPLKKDFTFYGTYDVTLRKEGFETLKTDKLVLAPWWQWVPFDFFAEFLPLTDRQKLKWTMTPASTQPADPEQMFERAAELKARLPATQPTSQPATTQPSR